MGACSKAKLDLLLLHVPKFNNFYDPIGHFILGNLLPMGIFSIANEADESGFQTRIYNLGLEYLSSKDFRIASLVRSTEPLLVGLDLHWHYQTHDVFTVISKIKEAKPGVPVVLGGYTATMYAEDILRQRPEVDFVIRGEAEKPVVSLLKALKAGDPLVDVANLSYRRNGQIYHNAIGFSATAEDLDRYDFARFDLLEHARLYFEQIRHIVWLRSFPKRLNFPFFTPGRMGGYIVPVARGCPVDCANCGGGRTPSKQFGMRNGVSMRSVEAVVRELRKIHEFGIRDLYFAFDPFPDSNYYPRLFRAIREDNLYFRGVFETFKLPTKALVEEFKKTFGYGNGCGNVILVSPETGDENLRRKNRGYFYTNSQLFDALDMLEKEGIPFQVSYTLGLPGESVDALAATHNLWEKIKRRYRGLVTQTATIIDADPFSPMEKAPSRYGITCRPRTLSEIDALHRDSYKGSHTGWVHLPIHHECDTLPIHNRKSAALNATDVYLREHKCRYFCHYFGKLPVPYPLNRIICKTAGCIFRAHSELFKLNCIRL
jgi:radical SAM superfamily enzyme YgiQ (UPF0313 family)